MQGILDWVKKTLSDDAGNPSTLRHLCVFVVVVPILGWLGFCLYEHKWQTFDSSLAALIGTVLAILGGRKAIETNGPTPGDPQP